MIRSCSADAFCATRYCNFAGRALFAVWGRAVFVAWAAASRPAGVFSAGFLLRTASAQTHHPPQDPKEESSPRQDPAGSNRF